MRNWPWPAAPQMLPWITIPNTVNLEEDLNKRDQGQEPNDTNGSVASWNKFQSSIQLCTFKNNQLHQQTMGKIKWREVSTELCK